MRRFSVIAIALSMVAYSFADTIKINTPAQNLINRLQKVESKGVVAFGHHDDTAYGHSWVDESGRSDVKEVCGDYPAIMDWDLGLIELNSSKNLDGIEFSKMSAECTNHDIRGGINSFSWHLKNPSTGGDSWDCSDSLTVHKAVTLGTAENDTLRSWISNVADYILTLKDKNGNYLPVIFRPWHEHTGSWFWWGKNYASIEDYKKLWNLTREIFDAKGVNNVVWAYSPDKIKNSEEYMERYPGDNLIDIMGTDIYHFNGADGLSDFISSANKQLSAAQKYAKERNKILALTETGSEGIPMNNWWTEVLLPLISKYPVTYVVVWRNAHDKPNHFYAPYPGHASVKSFLEFYNNPKTIFNREINNIK